MAIITESNGIYTNTLAWKFNETMTVKSIYV